MQNSAPLLSVVVAVYNGEAFLDQFFTCLVNQHIDSMEVIIVNDGSTDRSMQIVEKWREKLPQMQVIEQPNQGVSIARNTGLAVATGQYLSFPDIDDVFKPGMYLRLVDMTVGYDLSKVGLTGVSAQLNVNNLTDRSYVAACNSLSYCYFGAERSIVGSVSWKF